MSAKQVEIPNIGSVRLYKRRGSKNIKVTLDSDDSIRVSLPLWAPYSSGIDFVIQNQNWIIQQKSPKFLIPDNLKVGKSHTLHYITNNNVSKIRSRVSSDSINIFLPMDISFKNINVQKITKKACERALRNQAEEWLPIRLKQLAEMFNFSYRSISIKYLKARWGSCSSQKDITLSLFLMQLQPEFIDYVLLHELVHTRVLHHGNDFWYELNKYIPDAKQYKKRMRGLQPSLQPITSSYSHPKTK